MSENWYESLTDAELNNEIAHLEERAAQIAAQNLKLDMARGKPSREQLDLSRPMLDVLGADADLFDGSIDCANYGCFEGIPSARALFAELLGTQAQNVFMGGESSLTLEFDTLEHAMVKGVMGNTPLMYQMQKAPLKWICLVPGYDRHFAITQHFGFELIPAPLTGCGPDMDIVEELVKDPQVKGMWCVPQYSNPSGETYSSEVVERIANLKPAAADFRVYWDNAYCEHHLYEDDREHVDSIFDACEKADNPHLVYAFCSTSKMTFPGAGVSALAASKENLADLAQSNTNRLIGHDKLNQLRHARFFGDVEGLRAHMNKHAAVLRPRFDAVNRKLEQELGSLGVASWTHPKGGYFVSFTGMPGSAKATVSMAKELGITLTGAGSTWPYGEDPQDSNIRIAPTMPTLSNLEQALDVFTVCVKLVSARLVRDARR
ncbi:MAG: aminotransferase [Coriobacteriales bacterium]|nr:aminotransferase [Coriobacteriales bacterium]